VSKSPQRRLIGNFFDCGDLLCYHKTALWSRDGSAVHGKGKMDRQILSANPVVITWYQGSGVNDVT